MEKQIIKVDMGRYYDDQARRLVKLYHKKLMPLQFAKKHLREFEHRVSPEVLKEVKYELFMSNEK